MKEFPIPVRIIGPGSQPQDDETLDVMPMPQGMATYRAPVLPDGAGGRTAARAVLAAVGQRLDACLRGETPAALDLAGVADADRRLLGEILGEGEVSAFVRDDGPGGRGWRVQESVFTGVWRVLGIEAGQVVSDHLEVGAVPAALAAAAREDAGAPPARRAQEPPPGVQNAPALIEEIEDHRRTRRAGQPTHVINLTLLPVTPADIAFLDHHLGTGRVVVLSRGYGNCRITNCRLEDCWRVVYYNSQDVVILNTIEIGGLPEVAQACAEDLVDSRGRLAEVLQWMAQE